ncbi:MAG: hypothetical protein K2R98_19090 [Gemmataceae bacterium]|nr:hypothetical protein [Gemmataceae bacterium]
MAPSVESFPHAPPPFSLDVVALLLLGVVCIAPLVLDLPPVTWIDLGTSAWQEVGKTVVSVILVLIVAGRGWLDRRTEPRALHITVGLALLAGVMTECHYLMVDSEHLDWQRKTYLDILNHRTDPPHQYRMLPYGFTRLLECITGDWLFACLAYRWFFTYWFLWAWVRFARLFLAPGPAAATLLVLILCYPLSIQYYWGQLTDPLSHFLLVLGLVYVVEDRWLPLALALTLGILAKETALLLVPVYSACLWQRRRYGSALWKGAVLSAVGIVAFLAARLPLGWSPGAGSMNGVEQLMIATNLGLDRLGWTKRAAYTPVSWTMNYLHPALFVLPFVPFIVWDWRKTDGRLRTIFLTLTPLLLFSNLCFGWMYESRNYVPLLPVLTTMAVPGVIGLFRGEVGTRRASERKPDVDGDPKTSGLSPHPRP